MLFFPPSLLGECAELPFRARYKEVEGTAAPLGRGPASLEVLGDSPGQDPPSAAVLGVP